MIMHPSSVLLTAEQLHWKTMREKHFVSVPRLHLSRNKLHKTISRVEAQASTWLVPSDVSQTYFSEDTFL